MILHFIIIKLTYILLLLLTYIVIHKNVKKQYDYIDKHCCSFYLPNLPNSTLQLDLYDMSQTESGVRRRKSYDDLCDLQFVPYEASRLFFKAFTDSAITVFCDNLFHALLTVPLTGI